MKKILMLALFSFFFFASYSQAIKRIGKRIERKVENKIGEKIEKGIDKTVDGDKKTKEKTTGKKTTNESKNTTDPEKQDEEQVMNEEVVGEGKTHELQSFSRYDFVPGDKIIVHENFDADAVGDFPLKWNTNASGEIVTLNEREGKWLRLNRKGLFHPEFINSLPENFTLEFDLAVNNNFDYYSTPITINLTNLKNPGSLEWKTQHSVTFNLHPLDAGLKNGRSRVLVVQNGKNLLENNVKVNSLHSKTRNFAHIAIWRQKQRLRVYVNEEKVWDIPRAFDATQAYNAIVFSTINFHKDNDYYVLGDIKLATGAPDTRNKLLTEGKFITRGILFDINSDRIRPESYGTLKDISLVLSENPDVKVKIIGHTDSDGEDKSNLELSKRRAAAVKNTLVSDFTIASSRLETDGKGEAEPADKNNTSVGKANNRRVEFIKL